MKTRIVAGIAASVISLVPLASWADALDAKIADSAVISITKKNSPKIYQKWGADQIARINKLQPKAARKVAQSNRCDKVVWVSLSDRHSTVKKEAVFLVQCKNNERFFVSEKELGGKQNPRSVQEVADRYTDAEYLNACRRYSEQGFELMGEEWNFRFLRNRSTVYRAPGTGNVVVKVFTRATRQNNKSSTGVIETKCTFNNGKMIDVDVQNAK